MKEKNNNEIIEKWMNCDFRVDKNRDMLNNILLKVKRFRKYEGKKIPLIEIENFIGDMTGKYKITMQWITFTRLENDCNMFSTALVRTDTRQWLSTVYGHCLTELMVKVAIRMFFYIKDDEVNIKRREDD